MVKLGKFEKFFISYGEFHNNKVNKIIHVICVPLIVLSMAYLTRNFGKNTFLPGNAFSLVYFFVGLLNFRADFLCGVR